MNPSRLWAATALALSLTSVPAAFAAHAAKSVITSVSAVAQPENYSGDCPAALEFVGTVKVSKFPTVVEYLWERSNGTRTTVRRIEVRSAVQKITDEWGIGGAPGAMHVWERLKILSPATLSSAMAKATVNCK